MRKRENTFIKNLEIVRVLSDMDKNLLLVPVDQFDSLI